MSDVPPINISGLFRAPSDLGEPEFVASSFSRERYPCVMGRHLLVPSVMQLRFCGHRICYSCVDNLRHSLTGSKCPGGEEECNEVDVNSPGHVLPDVSTTRELARALIFCTYKTNGCLEQMPWKDLEEHVRTCVYKLIACRNAVNGCPEKLPSNVIQEHERNCLYVVVICQHCEQQFLRINQSAHDRECVVQIGRCPFSKIGCGFYSDDVEALQDHRKDAYGHMGLVAQEFERRQEIDRYLLQLINEMKGTIDQSARIAEVKRTVKDLKKKLDGKFKNTQKVVGKNSEMVLTLSRIEEHLKNLKPLQEQARVSDNRLNDLESERPTTSIPIEVSRSMEAIQENFNKHDKTIREMDLNFQCIENTAYDGFFIWKVSGYAEHKRRAVSGEIVSIYSQPFYTGRFGYKVCLRLYPNGDGLGRGSHISVYIVIMKGNLDPLLPWPFKQKVAFTLLDQDNHRRHVTDSFRPDPTSASFHQPQGDMNIASGLPRFLEQSKVETQTYLKDDCIFIQAVIDGKIW